MSRDIEVLIKKLNHLKSKEILAIEQSGILTDWNELFVHTGKLMAFDICIAEIALLSDAEQSDDRPQKG